MTKHCSHLDQIREVTPSANGCEDCLKIGDAWEQEALLAALAEATAPW